MRKGYEAFKKSYKGEINNETFQSKDTDFKLRLQKSKIKTSIRLFFQVTTQSW